MTTDAVKTHAAFELLRSQRIDNLDLTMHEFRHRATGASHYHLSANNAENVFMVALRTVPMDSTGVAHVLEHTALCGSKRYPVRDPFFWMIRRSLNTFMNAYTTNDYTAYPFASLNRKDFFNLLDVYLDAVFFANLNELDFAQEGFRIEFEDPADPTTDLVYRGVVYNEMKGDSSAPISRLVQALNEGLYPTTTYHYNSGGDPAHIPDLKYEQLLAFYRTHYHPSNAVFSTFGDIPPADIQEVMEARALSQFEALPGRIEVGRETRFKEPRKASSSYAIDDATDQSNQTHVVLGWLLGDNTDLDSVLRLSLMSDALLDTAASPLRHALETCEYVGALSPLCGLDESSREMSFVCGVEGTDAEHVETIEALVLATLESVAEQGIPESNLQACLHQLELAQREIGGDGSPFGLQLIFSSMSAAIHRGDPIAQLDLDRALERLRQDIQSPDFVPELIRTQLLNNPHRICLTMSPDPVLNEKTAEQEKQRLAAMRTALSADQADALIERAKALAERQASEDDISLLPSVGIDDIDEPRPWPAPVEQVEINAHNLRVFETGTNGLVYHQVASRLPTIPTETLRYLPLFTSLITELGSGKDDYVETQRLQHEITGGINAFTSFRAVVSDPDEMRAWLTLSTRGLERNAAALIALTRRTLDQPNLTERSRIRDLVRQSSLRRHAGIIGNGHGLAMAAAAAALRPVPGVQFQLSGLAGISTIKELDRKLDDASTMDQLLASLNAIATPLVTVPKSLLIVADATSRSAVQEQVMDAWQNSDATAKESSIADLDRPPAEQAWLTTTQVNFCAQAHLTVPEDHPDSAALSVLAGVMRNTFLHGQLREKGGAYGGGATHDAANGVFRFYSYRDPQLMATFDVFDECIRWAQKGATAATIEEAVLGIIASMDAPSSPAGEVRQVFQSLLFDRTEAHRRRWRDQVLAVTVEDLMRVTSTYLTGGPKTRAVITNETVATALPASFITFRI